MVIKLSMIKKCNYYAKNEYKIYYRGAGKQKHILSIKYGKET